MDIFPLLDELQTMARNGLAFASDPYDRERYTRLLHLAAEQYADLLQHWHATHERYARSAWGMWQAGGVGDVVWD